MVKITRSDTIEGPRARTQRRTDPVEHCRDQHQDEIQAYLRQHVRKLGWQLRLPPHGSGHETYFTEGEGLEAARQDVCNGNWLVAADESLYLLDYEAMALVDFRAVVEGKENPHGYED